MGKRGKGHLNRRSLVNKHSRKNEFFNSVGSDDRPSAVKSGHPVKPAVITKSHEVMIEQAAKHFEVALVEESVETHLIPRKSITDAQYLRMKKPQIETEAVHGRQLHGTRMVKTTDQRLTWKSDRTLLRPNNPFRPIKEGEFKREGKIIEGANSRKYRETVPHEGPLPEDKDTTLEIDVEF